MVPLKQKSFLGQSSEQLVQTAAVQSLTSNSDTNLLLSMCKAISATNYVIYTWYTTGVFLRPNQKAKMGVCVIVFKAEDRSYAFKAKMY